MIENVQELGVIKISDEVVATAAGIAAMQVAGVHGLHGSVREGLAELLGKKSATRGILVQMGEDSVSLTLGIEVEFGVRIPEIAWKVQQNVKRRVEEMTGLQVRQVSVNVQSVAIPKPRKDGAE
ncbi:Asp23/Gls24 family envelope stress response protein [bacterium]|nr:Asp23/Gls24 family envelope stress response protein [bacterium]